MAYKIQNKKRNELLEFINTLKLSLDKSDNSNLESLSEEQNKIIEFYTSDYKDASKSIYHEEQIVKINGFSNLEFVLKFQLQELNFLKEFDKNIKNLTKKHIALSYTKSLIFDFENILSNFQYASSPKTDLSIEFQIYNFTYSEDFPFWYLISDFKHFLDFLYEHIYNITEKIKLRKKIIDETPENKFETKMNTLVLALYYYFMFEAKLIERFDNYTELTKIEAMKFVLEKDGHKYTDHFKNAFYKIKTGVSGDPFTKKNIETALIYLKNRKAKKIALKILDEL